MDRMSEREIEILQMQLYGERKRKHDIEESMEYFGFAFDCNGCSGREDISAELRTATLSRLG